MGQSWGRRPPQHLELILIRQWFSFFFVVFVVLLTKIPETGIGIGVAWPTCASMSATYQAGDFRAELECDIFIQIAVTP